MTLGNKVLSLSACCLAALAVTFLVACPRLACAQQADGIVVEVQGGNVEIQVGPAPGEDGENAEDPGDEETQFFRPALNTSIMAESILMLVLDKYPDSDIPRQDILIRAALAARGAGFESRYATLAGQIDAGAVRPDATGKAVAATECWRRPNRRS